MKAVPAWLLFTVLRVLMFVVPFAVLLALGIEGWLAAVLAAIIGLCLSYIFLRTPRDSVARDLYQVRHREKEPVHPDAESEDAAVDRADAEQQRADQTREDAAEPDAAPHDADPQDATQRPTSV